MNKRTRRSFYYRYANRSWTNSIPQPSWTYGAFHTQVEDRVDTSGEFKDWKSRIRNQVNATSFLDGVQHTMTPARGGYWYVKAYLPVTDSYRYGEIQGPVLDYNLVSVSDPSLFKITSVRNRVIQDINSQIRSSQKSLQGLVALGEMGESVRMVNSLGRDLYGASTKYLRDLKQIASRLRPREVARVVSEKWLEYRFGIRPLVNDIGGFIDACYQNRYGRPPSVNIRASGKSSEKNPSTTSSFGMAHHLVVTTAEKRSDYGFRIYGVVGLTDNQVPPFSQEFGLTLDEFVPTLYELIPYSFLVDYVSNVGAIIDAYSLNKSTVKWLASGEERKSVCKLSAVLSPSFVPGWIIQDSVAHPCTPIIRTWRSVSRGMYSVGQLIPDLEFKIPGTSTKWLNISALAHLHAESALALRKAANRRT